MPYVRERTILQMAPRNMLPGIRLHQARLRGMGQYQGPCADPTQTMDPLTGICSSAAAIMNLPAEQWSVGTIPTQTQYVNAAGQLVAAAPTLSQWASQNSGIILGVGGALFLFAVLGAARR